MAPHGTLKTLVETENTFLAHSLEKTVRSALVPAGRSLVLHANLDELEGNNDEGLGGTGGGTSQDGKRLVHLGRVEDVAPDLAPLIVGGELGGTLRGFHEDGRRDTAVEAREAVECEH